MADNNGPGAGPGVHGPSLLQRFSEPLFPVGEDSHAVHWITLFRTHVPLYETSPRKVPLHGPRNPPRKFLAGLPHTQQPWKQTLQSPHFLDLATERGSFPHPSLRRNQLLDSLPNLNSNYWSLSQPKSRKINQDQTLQVKIPIATEINWASPMESASRETLTMVMHHGMQSFWGFFFFPKAIRTVAFLVKWTNQ